MAKQNLGMVTAYAYAVVGGYEGTEAEFEALLGNIATDLAEIENLTVIANTLPPGSSATASYDHGVLALGIPKGDKGDTGAGATVTAGTTTTGNPGTNASVTNIGTTKDAVFNFTIPRGDTGNGIESIYLTGTSGAVKTYTILFTDGNTTTFDVTDGEVTNAQLTAVVTDLKEDIEDIKKIEYGNESYYKNSSLTDNALFIHISESDLELTDNAIGTLTYSELFGSSHNITSYLNFESGSYSPAVRNAGNPSITTDDCYSKPYSLKCFGSGSQQLYAEVPFENGHYYYLGVFAKVSRYVQGWAGALFSTNYPANFSRLTDGYELASAIINTDGSGTTYIYFGSGSSADLDAYIDNVTFIDITNLFDDFSDTIAIRNTMDALLRNYVTICNSIYSAKVFRIPVQSNSTFIGTILGATSPTDRWVAMQELLTVGQKILENPEYSATDNDLPHASQGAVCLMPLNVPSMYEQYPTEILYAKSGTTQAIPASTTKVMTLVTGLDFVVDINERVTIINEDIKTGSPVFQNGDIVTIKDLMYAMLLPSSNTCANTFARICGEKILISQNGSGTYSPADCNTAFINQMAVKSNEIGLANSVWVSPSGLSSANKTTANDMLKIMVEACSYNVIQKIWNKKNYTINVKGTNARTETIQTSVTDNTFENNYYIFGGKTGTLYLDDSTEIALMIVAQAK